MGSVKHKQQWHCDPLLQAAILHERQGRNSGNAAKFAKDFPHFTGNKRLRLCTDSFVDVAFVFTSKDQPPPANPSGYHVAFPLVAFPLPSCPRAVCLLLTRLGVLFRDLRVICRPEVVKTTYRCGFDSFRARKKFALRCFRFRKEPLVWGTHKKMTENDRQELREFMRLKHHSHGLKNQHLS